MALSYGLGAQTEKKCERELHPGLSRHNLLCSDLLSLQRGAKLPETFIQNQTSPHLCAHHQTFITAVREVANTEHQFWRNLDEFGELNYRKLIIL